MSKIEDENPAIEFIPSDESPWVMKIIRENNKVQVRFNTKDYPDALENDFAEAVAKILCRSDYLKKWIIEERKEK